MAKTGGYFKLFRGVLDSELWYRSNPKCDFAAWIYLLARANYKPRDVRIGRTKVHVPMGSFITSTRKLGKEWAWSVGKVRRFLEELVEDERVLWKTDRGADRGYSMITIRNWEDYQIREDEDGSRDEPRTDRERIANGSRVVHRQEGEEGKEGGELSSVSLDLDSLLEEEKNGDDFEAWICRSTLSNRDDLAERRVEAEGCLRLYNELKGSSVALTSKIFRQYVALYDLWEDPLKILDAVKGLFSDPEGWAMKRNLGPEFAWKDPEIAERYVAHARDHWESGGWEKVLSMKKARRIRENE